MNTIRKNTVLIGLSSLALAASLPAATTYHIDFGINTQTTSGDYNNMTAGGGADPSDLTDLVDSTGGDSTIDLSYADVGLAGVSGTNPNYAGPYPAAVGSQPVSALRDGLFLGGGEITLTFSSLDPSMTYDFLLYGARALNGADTTYTATGGNTDTGTITNVLNNSTQTVNLSGLTANGSNEIVLVISSINSDSNNGGALNYLQLTAVPEPSAAALLGLGGLSLILRRRK